MATEPRESLAAAVALSSLPAGRLSAPAAPRLWCVGGGKGGVGKSLLAASLSWQLARLGRKVLAVDLDLGGANLHTCLGVAPPARSLAEFLQRRVDEVEALSTEGGLPGLRLVGGGAALLAGGLRPAQRSRLMRALREARADVVLLDLGAGTTPDILDFFVGADLGVLVVVPEPTSVENGYRFLHSALYRRLRGSLEPGPVRDLLDAALDRRKPQGIHTPRDLVSAVERLSPEAARRLQVEVEAFRPFVVVNQARSEADQTLARELSAVCSVHLGLHVRCGGAVHHDEAVWQGVRCRKLFLADKPGCRAAEAIRRLTTALVAADAAS